MRILSLVVVLSLAALLSVTDGHDGPRSLPRTNTCMIPATCTITVETPSPITATAVDIVPRGGDSRTPWIKRIIPAGWNPFGYKISNLGLEFLALEGSVESDVGRFLASLKTKRKRLGRLKSEWLEIVRVSKSAQSMRIYRTLQDLLSFCLRAGFVN